METLQDIFISIFIISCHLFFIYGQKLERPVWPDNYKACVRFQSRTGNVITAGWYVDSIGQRMRFDSYGIPEESKFTYIDNTIKNYEYACEPLGDPLYVFMYHYGIGKQLEILPSTTPPYKQCSVLNISNPFPPHPLVENLMFIERVRDNITAYDHWRAEYFLFTLDYMFHVSNGVPYKMFVNSDEHQFISFEVGEQVDQIFLPPFGVDCYYN